mmetsp:Transcript_23764/g.56112  ORF Transcript_23764/g.56112 Transcript_23764/m.56112 type:complete len:202 (-) Transcript_23764:159-764(-)|eukprot:CAMPEP_0113468880 /NCGR_PEP_ID=MMETSP0014_2-20120614/15596_1 /TAXON_ID=2857 /ORGANISM="Nitzschia sp." /LENGTH=201 /DNA_ID=CAMNT_0000361309 /DNA_START=84 /DNA_END=689 /DNA_ORIENTATION=- /assembly_acc=CAM_ASM_000159
MSQEKQQSQSQQGSSNSSSLIFTKKVIYLMGVSGCGKTTIGLKLAEATGGIFLDGDDYHPPANKQKMASGRPLEDNDRWPWFQLIKHEIKQKLPDYPAVIVACSALKVAYRNRLRDGFCSNQAIFVYLKGSKELISRRLKNRTHEYMPSTLLDSQFEALEEPTNEEVKESGSTILVVSIDQNADQIVSEILQKQEQKGRQL